MYEFDVVLLRDSSDIYPPTFLVYAIRLKGSELSDLHVYVNERARIIQIIAIVSKFSDGEIDRIIAAYEAAQALAAETRKGWGQ